MTLAEALQLDRVQEGLTDAPTGFAGGGAPWE